MMPQPEREGPALTFGNTQTCRGCRWYRKDSHQEQHLCVHPCWMPNVNLVGRDIHNLPVMPRWCPAKPK